jgi:N-acetylmuramoyl-L-alanine amidase
MLTGQKNFHKAFAPVSPLFALGKVLVFSVALAAILTAISVFAAAAAEPTASAVKRQAASSQYLRAEEQRSALSSKAPEKRTLAEYKQAVGSYHRVTLITPRAPEVPDSLLAIAELYTEMGDRFGRSYYQSAVDTYEFLVREYPTSKYCQDSLLRSAKLQRNQLGDATAATATYEAVVKKYPRSPRRREAQEALAEIALVQNSERGGNAVEAVPAPKNIRTNKHADAPPPSSAPVEVAGGNPAYAGTADRDEIIRAGGAKNGGEQSGDLENAPRVRRIRAGANGEATRVTIDLEGSVQYSSARISNPERIFFDLHSARLTGEVARGNVQVDGRLLTAVRVAQNQAGVVRVVLDVTGVKDYTASLSSNPPQLIIDLYGAAATDSPVRSARLKHEARMPAPVPVPVEDTRENTVVANTAVTNSKGANTIAENSGASKTVRDTGTSADLNADGTIVGAENTAGSVNAANSSTAPAPPTTRTAARTSTNTPNTALNSSPGPLPTVAAANVSPSVSDNGVVNEKSQRAKPLKATNASDKPDLIRTTNAAAATHDGSATLTRTLGLKIGRIVIDAGHGGHDTGTVGPTGLMEKDLCLDVALRLGKIIQAKLPGADVVYTRSDDTFIPLEERTNIANQAKADLFISIHANSSQDHAARGIETYYLNLRGTTESMEVAARENATSQQGIHDLQDVVRQIARTEKIDESKEFAEDVQDSLSKKIQKSAKTVKNRGVRKAPFVVLIGADMPSILTEISFLSNPADEQLLKKPEQRQHVAEGIFSGVSSYLESLNSLAFNQPGKPARPRPAASAVEQTANQK